MGFSEVDMAFIGKPGRLLGVEFLVEGRIGRLVG
jgi:hypothetical protein